MKKTVLAAVVGVMFVSPVVLAEKPEWAGQKPSQEHIEAHKESAKAKGA
jgi:hypothetical protein